MAIDPVISGGPASTSSVSAAVRVREAVSITPSGTIKRKKGRSKSGTTNKCLMNVIQRKFFQFNFSFEIKSD
jgi:hypothetical protein